MQRYCETLRSAVAFLRLSFQRRRKLPCWADTGLLPPKTQWPPPVYVLSDRELEYSPYLPARTPLTTRQQEDQLGTSARATSDGWRSSAPSGEDCDWPTVSPGKEAQPPLSLLASALNAHAFKWERAPGAAIQRLTPCAQPWEDIRGSKFGYEVGSVRRRKELEIVS